MMNARVILGLLVLVLCGSAAPGASREGLSSAYNIPEPWTSKALSPVNLQLREDLPPLTLLSKGQPACDIVIPSEHEYAAYFRDVATRLQALLKEATGVEIPIVKDRSDRNAIYIGSCGDSFVRDLYASCQEMPLETLCVASFEKGVVLAGRDGPSPVRDTGPIKWDSQDHSRGTFFAMVDFAERMLGFRFFLPGDMGLLFPVHRGETWTVPAADYTDHPVFPLRKSSYPYYETLDVALLKADKATRLLWDRMLRSGDVLFENFGHTETHWAAVYGKSHPEYFALRPDGTRMVGDRGPYSSQRCYANEAGLQEHLSIIARSLAGEDVGSLFESRRSVPNDKYIYWWPSDGYRGCACPECMKRTDPDAPYFARHAGIIWDYVLRLSAEVAKRWPDKILKVPLYSSYGCIPKGVRVPDNVALNVVRFGTGRFSAAYFKEPAYWQDALGEVDGFNAQSSQKIWIWVHYPHSPRIKDNGMIPYPVPHFMQRYLSLNRDKISGLYLNGHQTASFAFDGLMVYLWQKLLWNPDLDVDVMVDEFARLWGPAAPEMADFHKLLIDRWENTHWKNIPAPADFDFNMPADAVWKDTYPPEVRTRLAGLLDAAVRKTDGTLYGDRAHYLADGFLPFFRQGDRQTQNILPRADCNRLTPVVDGELSEWASTRPLRLSDNLMETPAAEETLFYTGFDADALFIAGRVVQKEPFRQVVSGLERDAPLWNNDSIEIFLCVNREGMKEAGLPLTGQYHHIILDSTGAIFDAYNKGGSPASEDEKENLDLTVRTNRTPGVFEFEMKIPFRSLGARPPAAGDEWPVNFYRTTLHGQPAHATADAWSPTGGSFHQPQKFGLLQFAPALLWEKTFDTPNDLFHLEVPPSVSAVTMENRGGQCRIHVVTPPGLMQSEIKLTLQQIPKHRATGHAAVEWTYRIEGQGAARIRSYGADSITRRDLEKVVRDITDHDAVGGTVTIRSESTLDGQPVQSISYFALGIMPRAGSDFTILVDRVRALDLKNAVVGATGD